MICFEAVLTPAAIQTVADLAREIWPEHYTPLIGRPQVDYMLRIFQSAESIRDQIENTGMLYYLIQQGESSVGYFAVQPAGDYLFLSKIYILKSKRGQGFSRKALLYMEDRARCSQLRGIRLAVNKRNTSSIQAYEKMGFHIEESVRLDIGEGFFLDDYRMKKEFERGM